MYAKEAARASGHRQPKNLRVDVRLTPEELELLDGYCQERGVSRPQGLRDGIKALHADKK